MSRNKINSLEPKLFLCLSCLRFVCAHACVCECDSRASLPPPFPSFPATANVANESWCPSHQTSPSLQSQQPWEIAACGPIKLSSRWPASCTWRCQSHLSSIPPPPLWQPSLLTLLPLHAPLLALPLHSTRGTPAQATSLPLSLNASDRKCPAGWIFPRKARAGRKAYGCCPLSSGWQGLWCCCILPRRKRGEKEKERKIACLGFGKSQAAPCSVQTSLILCHTAGHVSHHTGGAELAWSWNEN